MICIEFLKLACSVQNRPRVVNADFLATTSYSSSISGVSRIFSVRDFFRSAIDEIGNSDHQAVQAGCGA